MFTPLLSLCSQLGWSLLRWNRCSVGFILKRLLLALCDHKVVVPRQTGNWNTWTGARGSCYPFRWQNNLKLTQHCKRILWAKLSLGEFSLISWKGQDDRSGALEECPQQFTPWETSWFGFLSHEKVTGRSASYISVCVRVTVHLNCT